MVQVWDDCCQMSPEFDLMVADFLYLFLHLLEQSFELLHISELLINVLHLLTFLLNVEFYDVLIPEYSKPLLYSRPFLVSYLKLM